MNEIDILSRYLYSSLNTLLEIPIYNGQTIKRPTESTFCKFWVLDGKPIKYMNNYTAFTEFTVSVNVWSSEYQYISLEEIIDYFDGIQGVVVQGDEGDIGYIQSIRYDKQYTLQDDIDINYKGVGVQFKIRVKNK